MGKTGGQGKEPASVWLSEHRCSCVLSGTCRSLCKTHATVALPERWGYFSAAPDCPRVGTTSRVLTAWYRQFAQEKSQAESHRWGVTKYAADNVLEGMWAGLRQCLPHALEEALFCTLPQTQPLPVVCLPWQEASDLFLLSSYLCC